MRAAPQRALGSGAFEWFISPFFRRAATTSRRNRNRPPGKRRTHRARADTEPRNVHFGRSRVIHPTAASPRAMFADDAGNVQGDFAGADTTTKKAQVCDLG
ncbi:hypothetical protein SAMN04487905_106206 [Actinopolyspora xinjiangensis]|uniref:Uncharacterized protein n=1 Tax=Actinopolyspora xinjiangensis TaxID=405564 RepID=A0A1H0UD50_9ACTN|nr:hypothetical protein SAMN04487905_106206 [Actinopolyspora xinjiangensis]